MLQLDFISAICTYEPGKYVNNHLKKIMHVHINLGEGYYCNELGGNLARNTQFPIMIARSTTIYEIISPGAAGSSIYV